MGYRALLGLVLAAVACMGQHVQFGPLVNGFSPVRPALDARGNLVQVTQKLALGLCCGVGTGLVTQVERYDRNESSRVLADTGLGGSRDVPVFVMVDGRDRMHVGVEREAGRPYLLRIYGEARERLEVLGFGPDGAPVVAGSADGSVRAIAVDSTGSVYLGVGSSVIRVGGDSVDIGRPVTAPAVGPDDAVYAAGAGGGAWAGVAGAVGRGVADGGTAVGGDGFGFHWIAGGYRGGVVFFVLGGSVAAVDLDREEPSEVFRVVSGVSWRGLTALTPGQVNLVVPMGIRTNSWMVMPGVFARSFRWAGTNVEVFAAAVEGEWATVRVTGTGIGERFVVFVGERRVEEVTVGAAVAGVSDVRFRVVPEYAQGPLGEGGVLDVG